MIWMFTGTMLDVYEPISWLVKTSVISLFGFSANAIIFTSVLLHILNAFLLYACAQIILTQVFAKSDQNELKLVAIIMAIIFAVHPLRVEVVAWASGQSYAVGAVFFLTSLLMYLKYRCLHAREQPAFHLLLGSILAYLFAVMGKSAMVMLPAWLVLIDWFVFNRRDIKAIIIEKIPYALIAGVMVLIVLSANQDTTGDSQIILSWSEKIGRALISLLVYPVQTLWPTNLTPVYVLPHWDFSITARMPLSALGAILFIGVVMMRAFKANPWPLAVSIAYILMLLPVLGFIQHGTPTLAADRYSYISTIPFYLLAAGWVISKIEKEKFSVVNKMTVFFIVGALSLLTMAQTKVWRSDLSLWQHALEVQPYNGVAGNNLGYVHLINKRNEQARLPLEKAVLFDPGNERSILNLGYIYYELNRCDLAISLYLDAVNSRHPHSDSMHNNLGNCYLRTRQFDKATTALTRALELNPNHPKAPAILQRVRARQAQLTN